MIMNDYKRWASLSTNMKKHSPYLNKLKASHGLSTKYNVTLCFMFEILKIIKKLELRNKPM